MGFWVYEWVEVRLGLGLFLGNGLVFYVRIYQLYVFGCCVIDSC